MGTIKPQFGGCCGILAGHNIKQIMLYSEDLDIEKISEKIRSGKFQTRMITDILRDIYNISVVENETNKTVIINEQENINYSNLSNSRKISIINLEFFKNILKENGYTINNENILDNAVLQQKINLLGLYSDKFSHIVDIMNKKINYLSEISLTPFNKDNMIMAIMLQESLGYQIKLFEESLKKKIDVINEKIFGDDETSMKNNEINKKIKDDFRTFKELKDKYQTICKEYNNIHQSLLKDIFNLENIDTYINLQDKQKEIRLCL